MLRGFPSVQIAMGRWIARAQPMPRPPGEMKDRELSFVVPVRFNIR
jgi:hypothetical protein